MKLPTIVNISMAKVFVEDNIKTLDAFFSAWCEASYHTKVWGMYHTDFDGNISRLLGHDVIRLHRYNAAREFGCNQVEARVYALRERP